jgi:hypothetical protein
MKRRTWYGTLALIGYVLLGLGGCAIQPGSVYTKDGKQYGLIFPFCAFSQGLCGFPYGLSCNLFIFNCL